MKGLQHKSQFCKPQILRLINPEGSCAGEWWKWFRQLCLPLQSMITLKSQELQQSFFRSEGHFICVGKGAIHCFNTVTVDKCWSAFIVDILRLRVQRKEFWSHPLVRNEGKGGWGRTPECSISLNRGIKVQQQQLSCYYCCQHSEMGHWLGTQNWFILQLDWLWRHILLTSLPSDCDQKSWNLFQSVWNICHLIQSTMSPHMFQHISQFHPAPAPAPVLSPHMTHIWTVIVKKLQKWISPRPSSPFETLHQQIFHHNRLGRHEERMNEWGAFRFLL